MSNEYGLRIFSNALRIENGLDVLMTCCIPLKDNNMAFKHHHGWWRFLLCLFATSGFAAAEMNVFGKHYCEIVSTQDYSHFVIYNSENPNDCPHHWWSALKIMKLKRYLKANFIHLQGPNIWMVDRIIYPKSSIPKMEVEGKKFHVVGQFQLEWSKLIQHHGPYVNYAITKEHILFWNQGQHIYQLKDPQGRYYVLYGLSQKSRNIEQMKNKLQLPKGWYFVEGILAKNYELNSHGNMIYIIQDNLDNNYQRVSKSLLET